MGSETEYSIYSKAFDSDIAASRLVRTASLPPGIVRLGAVGEYLSNGGRYYFDHGSHPEYCSPETYGALESTVSEFAGVDVVREAGGDLKLQIDDYLGPYQKSDLKVIRRVSDGYLGSTGHHINMRAGRELDMMYANLAPQLIHMIGGTLLFGAGCVRDDGSFTLSQKGPHITDLTAPGTTYKSKPLINLRDECLDDYAKWRRLHITGNDSLFSPWATWLRYATFDITVAFCEERPDQAKKLAQYLPTNLRKALGLVNKCPDNAILLSNSQELKAKELEWIVFETVLDTYKAGDLDEDKLGPQSIPAFEEWQWALETDDEALTKIVDWRLRSVVHDRLDDRYERKVGNERRFRDVELDDILKRTPGANLFQNVLFHEGLNRLAHVFDTTIEAIQAKIERRVVVPPLGRASVRGEFIWGHQGEEYSIHWEDARRKNEANAGTYYFSDDGIVFDESRPRKLP
jgi:hypothetical protein